jgi:hypothetical protein
VSDVIYPISLIENLAVQRMARTLMDEFEAGNVSTRRYWDAQNFKRRLTISHGHLTPAEFRYLRSFHSQRSGEYDSFWFRDNLHRGGNIKARFAAPLPEPWNGGARRVQVALDEVAPIRALPEFDELATAAGSAPLFWYDANRELYLSHLGSATLPTSFYDGYNHADGAALQAGTFPLANYLSQYQHYGFDGAAWGKTSANINIGGTKPPGTLFAICKHGTIASQEVVFAIGAMGAGNAMGLAVDASNYYVPWIGGSETWSTARQNNSTNNTWRSFAVTFGDGSNSTGLWVNTVLAGPESNTRNYTAGPLSLGAALDGTLKCTGSVAHVLAFASVLTLAQIKAVHNLLGYQYGLSTVS